MIAGHGNFISQLGRQPKIHPLVSELMDGKSQFDCEQRLRLNTMFASFCDAGLGDKNFVREFACQPIRMYWELLLGCTLLSAGHKVTHSPIGPDYLVEIGSRRVWIEATSPDGIAELPRQEGSGWVPAQAIELSATGALKNKLDQWSKSWGGIIRDDDCVILALNTFAFEFNVRGEDVAKAFYGVGPMTWVFGQDGGGNDVLIDEYYEVELKAANRKGVTINKSMFLDGSAPGVSAILHGHFNLNFPVEAMLTWITLFHNPTARSPLPVGLLKFGKEYRIERDNSRWRFAPAVADRPERKHDT